MTFVIRVRRDRQALRGQVVAVATGEARLPSEWLQRHEGQAVPAVRGQ